MRFANSSLIIINETLVADANSKRGARAVATVRLTDRFAYVFRTSITKFITVVTTASLWCDASAHFAWFTTDWFANARVHRCVTVVTGTHLRCYARAENAGLVAFRGENADKAIELVHLVTIQTFANIRRNAVAVYARAITNRLARERGGVVFDYLVTGTARADMRFVAISVATFAFLVADRTTSESVRIHPIVLVTATYVRFDARAVDATIRALRYTCFLVVRVVRSAISYVTCANVRFQAVSLLAR